MFILFFYAILFCKYELLNKDVPMIESFDSAQLRVYI